MISTKTQIFVIAYSICALNYAALIFYSFELLAPEGVIELFVIVSAVLSFSLIFDLHRYNKEQRVEDQAGVQNEEKIHS